MITAEKFREQSKYEFNERWGNMEFRWDTVDKVMIDLTLEDFKGLEFDLSNDDFFNRIKDYGIELLPTHGHSIKVPGYRSNNGYYSDNLSLILTEENGSSRTYDVTNCQSYK